MQINYLVNRTVEDGLESLSRFTPLTVNQAYSQRGAKAPLTKSWGLKLMKRRGPKRARVAVARRLAILLGRIWKDKSHFDAVPA